MLLARSASASLPSPSSFFSREDPPFSGVPSAPPPSSLLDATMMTGKCTANFFVLAGTTNDNGGASIASVPEASNSNWQLGISRGTLSRFPNSMRTVRSSPSATRVDWIFSPSVAFFFAYGLKKVAMDMPNWALAEKPAALALSSRRCVSDLTILADATNRGGGMPPDPSAPSEPSPLNERPAFAAAAAAPPPSSDPSAGSDAVGMSRLRLDRLSMHRLWAKAQLSGRILGATHLNEMRDWASCDPSAARSFLAAALPSAACMTDGSTSGRGTLGTGSSSSHLDCA
mmetsp:Transcript_133/g.264  ORF Transcript_133/g.264 Transcript_133/m.264 type:complete len:286 (+) Transcript_133:2056-2913(+)